MDETTTGDRTLTDEDILTVAPVSDAVPNQGPMPDEDEDDTDSDDTDSKDSDDTDSTDSKDADGTDAAS